MHRKAVKEEGMLDYRARALCFGDDINTDYIISSRRKKDTIDPDELVPYLMEDIRPGFYKEIKGDSILIAGSNFGCGSAMEVAAQIVKSAGFPVIIASSFARSYYRNAVNNGVMPLEMDTSSIKEGDIIHVIQKEDGISVENERTGERKTLPPFSGKVGEILSYGGIVEYIKSNYSRREK